MSISASRKHLLLFCLTLTCAWPALAIQAPAPASPVAPFDEFTSEQWKAQAAGLLSQAKASPTGTASVTLKKYPGHFTMLTVRTRSGGAEQHDHAADIFFVLDGEATEITGGTIEGASMAKPGETRGSGITGGTEHRMQTGDIIHIAPGTPHQTLVAPGKTFTYYVIKVDQ
ncbi:cupin domain-containing protein [Silvibacterium sp.]|uniref:cupin domain-containing protein n=1 Tax=Silvibacterium sp. TaxID=1964179 RepID=UPI0039E5F9E5